ncbi:methyltransferase domain-containing protein [Colletotrichum camelliae]|nr:methyltransferase domain-containing protein [Colletotrichum camelliae]
MQGSDVDGPDPDFDTEVDEALGVEDRLPLTSVLGLQDFERASLYSVKSEIKRFQFENGRTYHSMSEGKYNYPNDDEENSRLELQHRIWNLTLDGELALCPAHKTAKHVLDMGTGTGIWAIDYADAFPSAQVIGVDLSPIQPEWVPNNCSFEIDDLEKRWAWSKPFDFIFCRTMEGSFSHPVSIIHKIYEALEPGGWFEAGGFVLPIGCIDKTLFESPALMRWHETMYEAGNAIGRSIESPSKHVDAIHAAGFVDVTVKRFAWPLNSWPKDKKLKEIGMLQYVNLDLALEGLSLGLFTRALGWTRQEVMDLCSEARMDLKNRRVHAYWNV